MSPAATLLQLRSSGPKPMISMSNYTTSSSYSPRCAMNSGNRFRICRYSIKRASTVPDRTPVVFKESRSGSHFSGFRTSCTSSDNGSPISEKISEDDDAEKGLSGSDFSSNPPPAPVLPENPDLLKIPGIGPKNLTKLVEKDIAGVADLKKIYKDQFSRKSYQKMVEYLQSSVGIKNKSHAQSIATFIKKNVRDEEMKDGSVNSDAITARKKKTPLVDALLSDPVSRMKLEDFIRSITTQINSKSNNEGGDNNTVSQ